MGKPKGKRAWRKNIDLGEADYVDAKNEDARLYGGAGSIDELPDDSLFFVDDEGGAASGGGMVFASRKEKARAKVLRVDALLAKGPPGRTYPTPVPRKRKGPPTSEHVTKGAEAPRVPKSMRDKAAIGRMKKLAASHGVTKDTRPHGLSADAEKVSGKLLYKPSKKFTLDDVLNDDPDAPRAVDPYDLWGAGVKKSADPVTAKDLAKKKAGAKAAEAAFFSKHRLGDTPRAASKREAPYKPNTAARAVEVDAAGCSYNPPEDARQDVIAAEVGKEMQKKLKKQLDPVKAPVSNNEANMRLAEEMYYAQENLYEDEGGEGEGDAGGSKGAVVTRDGKMTKAERNKQLRKREQEAQEAANRLAKRQRRDLSNLKQLKAELEAEEAAAADKRARRRVARDERKLEAPGRLGKHLYQPEPAAVLLTEEVTGSYRQLAGCHTLLRDRLKSLQRRELVEPRKRVEKVKSKNFMKYEPGAKGEKEEEMHESNVKATMANRKMKASLMT